ncbi:MAG: cobalamin biosynthesis protein [Bacteroidetes bacterium]|nr:cobalamin biosynthesis protein [Bacteroidota bacterium]
MTRLQKKILVFLIVLVLITPAGIFLPMFFDAGDAWGEWSAQTVKGIIGYVPEGLAKYTDTWKAPVSDYTLDGNDPSLSRQSVYYIISGIAGAAIALAVTWLLSKIIIRNEK